MSQQQTVLRVQSNIPGSLLPVYEFLDLYTDIPIKLNKSFAEIQDIGKKNTDYTIGLTIPGSKKNNRFFENFFNVDAQSLYFDATKRNNCDVLLGDEPLFRGYMRLNKVSVMNSKIQYDVTLYSTVSNLFGAIGNNLLRDLNYADSDYHFNHIFNLSNVTQNFNFTNFSIDGEKPYPYLYPIVHNGYNYVSGATPNVSGTTLEQTRIYSSTSPISGFTSAAAAFAAGVEQYHINSPTQGLINNQLKPAMNVWSILQLMFKKHGYTIKSDFFNTPWMKSLYIYGYFSSEATKFSYKINTIQEFAPEGVELITIVSGGNANVYVCKVGTGIPCYSLSDINIIVETEFYNELPATIRAFTTGTTVNLGGNNYVETRTNSFATISAGPIKYLPQAVGTSIPYTDGLPVDFSQVIDINIKQIDLLGSIAKKFNLVFVSNPDNPIEIEIEPYDFYIGTGTIYDWTDKISYDRGWSVEPALNFVESQLTISDLEDSDEGNKQFKQRNNRVYGSNIVYNPTDFKSQEKSIETIFGPELIRKWDDSVTDNIGLPLGINYVASNQPRENSTIIDWQYTGIKTKPKLMFWLGGFNPFLDIVGETYNQSNFPTYKVYVNNSDATTYFTSDKIPVISHTMPMGLSDEVKNSYNGNDSLCILFNSEQVTDIEGTIRTYNTYTENDAYNKFYNNRITNIYNPNTRFLNGFFNLKYNDVKLLKPNDIIKIQEQYFSWNKISDFNLTQREMTNVELVQLNVNPQEYPTRYFIYEYCDGNTDCFKIKTDFTNPNLRDTNFGWSVYYDFQVGSLSGQTSGYTSTFVDIQDGFPKYVPYSMYEVTKEQYDSTTCESSDCGDTLLTYIIDNDGIFSSANMPTFWTNSGVTTTGINVFNNCAEFNSVASTYGILTGTSTYHGSSICPTPTPTSSPTPTPTPTPSPTPGPLYDDILLAIARDDSLPPGSDKYDLIISTDGGNSFVALQEDLGIEYRQTTLACSYNAQIIYRQNISDLYISKSTDGGVTFNNTNMGGAFTSMICSADGSKVGGYSGEYFTLSEDYGNTSTTFQSPGYGAGLVRVPWYDVDMTNTGYPIYLVGYRENNTNLRTKPVYILTGYTSTIQELVGFPNSRYVNVATDNSGQNIIAGTSFAPTFSNITPIYKSTNGGTSSATTTTGTVPQVLMSYDSKYMVQFSSVGTNPANQYASLSTDSGTTWNTITELNGVITNWDNWPQKTNTAMSWNGKNMYVSNDPNYGLSGMWVSNDYGDTWTNKTYPKYNVIYQIYSPKKQL